MNNSFIQNQELRGKLIEQKMLERVIARAEEKTRHEICRDCRDQRCQVGRKCNAWDFFRNAYAWDIMAASAEMN